MGSLWCHQACDLFSLQVFFRNFFLAKRFLGALVLSGVVFSSRTPGLFLPFCSILEIVANQGRGGCPPRVSSPHPGTVSNHNSCPPSFFLFHGPPTPRLSPQFSFQLKKPERPPLPNPTLLPSPQHLFSRFLPEGCERAPFRCRSKPPCTPSRSFFLFGKRSHSCPAGPVSFCCRGCRDCSSGRLPLRAFWVVLPTVPKPLQGRGIYYTIAIRLR